MLMADTVHAPPHPQITGRGQSLLAASINNSPAGLDGHDEPTMPGPTAAWPASQVVTQHEAAPERHFRWSGAVWCWAILGLNP